MIRGRAGCYITSASWIKEMSSVVMYILCAKQELYSIVALAACCLFVPLTFGCQSLVYLSSLASVEQCFGSSLENAGLRRHSAANVPVQTSIHVCSTWGLAQQRRNRTARQHEFFALLDAHPIVSAKLCTWSLRVLVTACVHDDLDTSRKRVVHGALHYVQCSCCNSWYIIHHGTHSWCQLLQCCW